MVLYSLSHYIACVVCAALAI